MLVIVILVAFAVLVFGLIKIAEKIAPAELEQDEQAVEAAAKAEADKIKAAL